MDDMPVMPCSRCGSGNTELWDKLPDGTLLVRLAERLLRQLRPGRGILPGGQHVLICRDCGYVAFIQVR